MKEEGRRRKKIIKLSDEWSMERLITRSAGQRKSKTKLMKNLTKKTMTF